MPADALLLEPHAAHAAEAAEPAALHHPYERARFVLLTGVGRSGARAVHAALGSHLAIDSTDCENNVVGDLLLASWRNCTLPSRVHSMRLPREDHIARIRSLILWLLWPQPDHSVPDLLLAYSALPSVEGAQHHFEVFPSSRLIAIVRDGVEVVASRMLHQAFKADSFESHCMAWTRQAQIALWAHSRRSAHMLRHEQLLERTSAARALDSVWGLLRVEPSRTALDRLLASARVHPTHHQGEADAGASDLTSRKDGWRHWGDAQREVFSELCAEEMRALRYSIPWEDGE